LPNPFQIVDQNIAIVSKSPTFRHPPTLFELLRTGSPWIRAPERTLGCGKILKKTAVTGRVKA